MTLDTEYNDRQHKDSQHNSTKPMHTDYNDSQNNGTQHSKLNCDTQLNIFTNLTVMLSVVMLNVNLFSVVAPNPICQQATFQFK